MKKSIKAFIGAVSVLVAFAAIVFSLALVKQERTKDFKTSEEWALAWVAQDFLRTRDVSEVAYYTIDKLNTFIKPADYDRADLFKIVMGDIRNDEEKYRVVVKYNFDKCFLGIKGKFGIEHIVDLDFERI